MDIIIPNNKESKKVFLIGKDVLNFLINPVQLYKKVILENPNCKKCIFNTGQSELAKEYCSRFCEKKTKTILIPKFINSKLKRFPKSLKRIKIPGNLMELLRLKALTTRKTTYVTSLQSKLILVYYKLASNKGIINTVPKKYLARELGCTGNSIDNCNKILQRYGLITYQVDVNNNITVILNKFNSQYEEAGHGYIVMSSSLLNALLNIKKLHELRMALKLVVLYDSNSNFGRETILTVQKLKEFLPDYSQKPCNIRKFVSGIINSFSDGLEIKIRLNTLVFNLKNSLDGKFVRKYIFKKYKKLFFKYINSKKVPIPSGKAEELANLALEYNVEDVFKVLHSSPNDILFASKHSLGAYVRYQIRRYYDSKIFFSMSF